jgi:hypothetical protein
MAIKASALENGDKFHCEPKSAAALIRTEKAMA